MCDSFQTALSLEAQSQQHCHHFLPRLCWSVVASGACVVVVVVFKEENCCIGAAAVAMSHHSAV